jgi:hypothetical protein
VLLGKVSVAWLSSTVEELVQKAEANEFFKSTREGSKALIAQRRSNKYGHFGGGGVRGWWS